MERPRRCFTWSGVSPPELESLLLHEWLVTNGLGGYAAGTVPGAPTRRYHGLLIAALPAPHGRMLLLPHLSEQLQLPDAPPVQLGDVERTSGPLRVPDVRYLREFRLEAGLLLWRYEVADIAVEKRLLLLYGQNTVHVTYRLVSSTGPVGLHLRPAVHCRPHDAPVNTPLPRPFALRVEEDHYELSAGAEGPTLRFMLAGQQAVFTAEDESIADVLYQVEARRGYEATGELWYPRRLASRACPGAGGDSDGFRGDLGSYAGAAS